MACMTAGLYGDDADMVGEWQAMSSDAARPQGMPCRAADDVEITLVFLADPVRTKVGAEWA